MKRILNLALVFLLALTTLVANPDIIVKQVSAENKAEDIVYNDFTEMNYDWDLKQGAFKQELKNDSLYVTNTSDSRMYNKSDAIRNNGDVAINFEFNSGMKCFGFVYRANNDSYQNAVYNFHDNKVLLGSPGNWGTYNAKNIPNINPGQNINLVVRYEGTNLAMYVEGIEVYNGEARGSANLVNANQEGVTGLRSHCLDATVKINTYVSGPLNSIPNEGFPEIGKDITLYDFDTEVESLTDKINTFDKKYQNGKLTLTNNSQESILYDTADKNRKSGDIELDFKYSAGQRCFGPTFRSTNVQSEWQSVTYGMGGDGIPYWSVGHPSGYWSDEYPVKNELEDGKEYKMVVRYKGSGVQVYVNGELELDEAEISTKNGLINPNDSAGKVGFRKHCVQESVTIDRMISADYGHIPNEGLPEVVQMKTIQEPEEPEDPSVNKEYFENMTNTWKTHKVGDFSEQDLSNPVIQNHISNVVEDASTLYDSILPKEDWLEKGVWAQKSTDKAAANITTQFKNLAKIAQAYATEAPGRSGFYHNPEILEFITDALESLTSTNWYDGKRVIGNWWDWQIGIAQELIDILMIMSDDLSPELVKKYATIVHQYIPNPTKQVVGAPETQYRGITFGTTTTGANRTDLALGYLGIGILLEDTSIMKDVVPSIEDVFKIKTSGDGFYADGSFIQHGDIPYTGSYGNIAIKGVGKILSYLEGTPWQLSEDGINTFSKLVYDTFIPVIYKGETMPMVGGRSISRAPGARKEGFGSATIYNLLIVSNFASEPYRSQLREAAKYWINEDETDYYYNNNRDLRDILEILDVVNDKAVKGDSVPFLGGKVFAGMDRFIHTGKDYSLGISMYSSRISSYEAGNEENAKGWFTSDGMVYLQNQDTMYGESYWPTVDWYRLPGTTVDTRKLSEKATTAFTRTRSPQSYVGGVTDGNNSAVGMVLNKSNVKDGGALVGYDLKAFKSWFVKDDVMYALGAGINGTSTDGSIQTIVENRLLDPKMNYELKSNIDFNNNSTFDVKAGDWFLLEADQKENNIGYVFLADQTISLVEETNTGIYYTINERFVNDKTYTESYQKIIIEHGKTSSNGSYAYATLPSVTEAELTAFVASDFEVVSNTADNQTVRVGSTLLGHVYPEAGGKFADISVNGAASFIVDENDTEIVLSTADTKQRDIKFDFTFNRDRLSLQPNSRPQKNLTVSMDLKGTKGGTLQQTIYKYAELTELEDKFVELEDIDIKNLTEYSLSLYNELYNEILLALADDSISQVEVDALVANLKAFLESYDEKINFIYADITIDSIKSVERDLYTQDSLDLMDSYVAQIEAVKAEYDETSALLSSNEEVDKLVKALQDSILNLQLKDLPEVEEEVNTDLLEEYISLFHRFSFEEYEGTYHEQFYLQLKDIVDTLSVDTTTSVKDLTQAEVDQLVSEMESLFKALLSEDPTQPEEKPEDKPEVKPEEPGTTPETPGTDVETPETTPETDLPGTGVQSTSVILYSLVTIGFGIVLLRKRKYMNH